MKANEFVKKYGWYEATAFLSLDSDIEIVYTASFFDELKRIVESHHIVNTTFKGLEDAKWWHECCWDCDSVAYIPIERLKQAIADVESCQ